MSIIRYTTAPRAYDYAATDHLGVIGHTDRGVPVRKVRLNDEERAGYQEGRYASGMHRAFDEAELAERVKHGFVTLSPSANAPVHADFADFRRTLHEGAEQARKDLREVREDGQAKGLADFREGILAGLDMALSHLRDLERRMEELEG